MSLEPRAVLSGARPRAQSLRVPGPAGELEAVLEDPKTTTHREPDPGGFAVVCHPHPLHGGTLHNKVVYTLARVFLEMGLATLRFNFRGVGASAGSYGHGSGELEDALAVIAYGKQRWPGVPVFLGGFSFGAMIALGAADQVKAALLISVAPAVGRPEFGVPARPPCPWLIVQGDADEIVDYRQVVAFAAGFTPAPQLTILPGVGHFFHGRLQDLHEAALAFARNQTR